MKKTITKIATALLLILSVSACSEVKENVDVNLIKDGTLYAATSPDYPPFEYLEGNEIVGFDIELLNEIASMSGLEVEYTALSFETILTAVQAGQFDVGMSAFSATPDREVLFTDSYYDSSQVALLPLNSEFKTIDELYGKKLGAGMGTTGEEAAKTISDDIVLLDTNTALPMLSAGQIDAYVCDIGVAENAVATGKYALIDKPISKDEFSIVLKAGNNALCNLLNQNLAKFRATDAYDELLAKYGLN